MPLVFPFWQPAWFVGQDSSIAGRGPSPGAETRLDVARGMRQPSVCAKIEEARLDS